MTSTLPLTDGQRMAFSLHDLAESIKRHALSGAAALMPGMMLLRSDTPTTAVSVISEPMLCIVAQGSKRIVVGTRVLDFGSASSLIVTMTMPVASNVVQASAAEPYLAVGIPLDAAVLADLLLAMPASDDGAPVNALDLQPVTLELLETTLRLLRLLDRPADIPILAPQLSRELLYRLLTGPNARAVRNLVQQRGPHARVASAAAWIRDHYQEPLHIAELAKEVSMTEVSLHRHFKYVTGMSPLQYQKKIRLMEARSRLLVGGSDAASIGFSVGYNNPSQFSREYARQFGRPPARDAAQLRAENFVPSAI